MFLICFIWHIKQMAHTEMSHFLYYWTRLQMATLLMDLMAFLTFSLNLTLNLISTGTDTG